MPGRTRRTFGGRRAPRVRIGAAAPSRFYAKRRQMFNKMPTFTETVDFGTNSMPASGPFLDQFKCRLNSIPQFANYAALYNQARIIKVQYLIMPAFTQYAPTSDATTATQSVSCPRFVYSIQDTANAPPPTSELDVLTDNGCKIKLMNKPIKINTRPVPWLNEGISLPSTNLIAWTNRRRQWLTTDTVGQAVYHGGVNYAITQDVLAHANPQTQWAVYAKITFQLRDPK